MTSKEQLSWRLVPIAPTPKKTAAPPPQIIEATTIPETKDPINDAAAAAASSNALQLYIIDNATHAAAASAQLNAASMAAATAALQQRIGPVAPPEKPTTFTSTTERRRATHNEVERRRRDTINSWIMKLGKLIPDQFNPDHPAGGGGGGDGSGPPRTSLMSKGGILARACDYLTELRKSNHELTRQVAKAEDLQLMNEKLLEELEAVKSENESLRRRLEDNLVFIKDHPEDDDDEDEMNLT